MMCLVVLLVFLWCRILSWVVVRIRRISCFWKAKHQLWGTWQLLATPHNPQLQNPSFHDYAELAARKKSSLGRRQSFRCPVTSSWIGVADVLPAKINLGVCAPARRREVEDRWMESGRGKWETTDQIILKIETDLHFFFILAVSPKSSF